MYSSNFDPPLSVIVSFTGGPSEMLEVRTMCKSPRVALSLALGCDEVSDFIYKKSCGCPVKFEIGATGTVRYFRQGVGETAADIVVDVQRESVGI